MICHAEPGRLDQRGAPHLAQRNAGRTGPDRAVHARAARRRSTRPTNGGETSRGAAALLETTMQVGEALPGQVKGHATTRRGSLVHLGWGMQLTPPRGFGIARRVRGREGPGRTAERAEIPDTVQRPTGKPARARSWGLGTRPTTTAELSEDVLCTTSPMDGRRRLDVGSCRASTGAQLPSADTTWVSGRV